MNDHPMAAQTYGAQQASGPFGAAVRSDIVRDGVAGALLLLSLTMPWGLMNSERTAAATRVDVLLITLLSIVTLALPYLARAGALPATWNVLSLRRARLVGNLPYVGLVLVYYTLDLVRDEGAGVGGAAAVGLAGAALAAVPRLGELGPVDQDRAISGAWRNVVLGGTVAVAAMTLIALVAGGAETFRFMGAVGIVMFVLQALIPVALALVCLLGVLRGSAPHAIAYTVLGSAVLLGVLAVSTTAFGGVYYARWTHMALVVIPAIGAVAGAPAVIRGLTPSPGEPGTWFGAASRVLELMIVLGGSLAVVIALSLTQLAAGVQATVMVIAVLTVVAALVARAQMRRNPTDARPAVLGLLAATVLFGLVALLLMADALGGVDEVTVVLFVGLPVGAGVLLLAPVPVRQHFVAHGPQRAAPPAWATASAPISTPTPTLKPVPAPAPAPAQEAPPVFSPELAADPSTPRDVLIAIVQQVPWLRPAVAANPALDEPLQGWMRQIGDPAVDAVLDARRSDTTGEG